MFKKSTPYLIAEIGGNHEGNFSYAIELTHLAIESGVDSIKYQIYTGDTLVSSIQDQNRNNHFKKFELSLDEYTELAELCIKNNVDFSASVWNNNSIWEINDLISFYKIGSGDLTNFSLIKDFCSTKKPIILSTGLSTLEEVRETVKFIQNQDSFYMQDENLAILQCTSMYPIPARDANLLVIKKFKEIFNNPIGYSDHTEGSKALLIAVAMGAEILEFHFTDTREGKEFRDHKVSLTKSEVQDLKKDIKEVIELQGSEEKQPLEIELNNGHHLSFRRSVYAARDLNPGDILSRENIITLRPLHGIDARDYFNILGKKVISKKNNHESLSWDDIED
jgi:N,N'-diacetyllegionaminate synthase